jgi:hypothetical protein
MPRGMEGTELLRHGGPQWTQAFAQLAVTIAGAKEVHILTK